MVRKLLRFLNRETSNLHSAAYLLGFFSFLSQILAFLRDRLLAHIFGASETLDIYYAAFRIPDFIFVAVASIVSLSVLVPFIIERDGADKEKVREFIDNIFTFFALLIIGSSAIAFFLIPSISSMLFKGFSPEALEEVAFVSRIMLISPIALGFSNLLGSLTQAYNRFTIYALGPLLYNTGIILGIIFLGERYGAAGVGIGVAFGALMHALVQVPFVLRMGLFPRLLPHINFSSIRKVVALSLPRTLSLSTNYIAILFLISFASLMASGSISILSLSINLQSMPLAIVGISYSLAAFPTLSRHFNSQNMEAFTNQMAATARHIIFWALPLSALLIVLRAQIVRVLLGTGAFDWNDTRLTAAALALFVASAVFQCLLSLLMRGFYASGRTREPFLINLFSTAIIMAAAYGLVKLSYASEGFIDWLSSILRVGDIPNTVVLMLPLAFSLGTAVNAILHWIWFERTFSERGRPGLTSLVSGPALKTFLAAIVMGGVAYGALAVFAPAIDTSTLMGVLLHGLVAGLLAILAGAGMLHALKSQELKEVVLAARSKFWKSKVIATDPEIV